jgi:shikimate dehydrogenase
VSPASRLWLLGSRVSTSPSPAMHNAALRALGVDIRYEALEVDEAGFDAAVARLRGGEAMGANVTIPYKRRAAQACDSLEGDAAALRAVNTVVAGDGRLIGANTDAAGLEHALREEGLWPGEAAGGLGVVLGAGGAAAAVTLVLARMGVDRVVLAARRPQAASEAAADLGRGLRSGTAVEGIGLATAGPLLRQAGWVVNATPAGLADLPIEPERLARSAVVVDLRYRPRPVDLVAAATAAGLRACDGLEMLVAQGMLSLRRWTGLEPAWDAARDALLSAVAA